MASSVVQAGSPLDNYFNDEIGSHEASLEQSISGAGEEAGNTTLMDDMCDTSTEIHSDEGKTGWTGVIPNISSSSRSSPTTSPSRQPRHTYTTESSHDHKGTGDAAQDEQMEIFGERFKYLICTSGLLEKVYVPCLGGPRIQEKSDAILDGDPDLEQVRIGLVDWRIDLSKKLGICFEKMRERPDIVLAGVVLLVAMAWVIGWKLFMVVILAVSAATGFAWRRRLSRTPTSAKAATTTALETTIPTDPNSETLASLRAFLVASTSLDSAIDSALSIVQSQPESSTSYQGLRFAIHRLTETMTDHLGTATSTLLEMVDRNELSVLGEMYDIPIGPSSVDKRRKRANTDISDDQESIDSLKRLSWNASKPLIPLSLPMGTSTSSPARLRPDRQHTVHLSLGGMPSEDRFTSLPRRTPRAAKRSSWAPEWNDRLAKGVDLVTLSEKALSTVMSNGDSSDLQHSSSDDSRDRDLPITPNPHRALMTPRRSSPLSRRDSTSSDMPHRHIFPIVPPTPAKHPLMPSPFKSPIRDDQKRRSLQSMPYFHSDKSDFTSPGRSIAGSSDMGRPGSLQISDLQMLRDQSTNGLIPYGSVESFALSNVMRNTPDRRTRQTRSVSLSPLTSPGLKAACLGVHMKRRRVACCLLGLRFEQDPGYWTEVKRTMDDLVIGITSAVAVLNEAQQEARSINIVSDANRPGYSAPPWTNGKSPIDATDFAPRTSDHALLLEQIGAMQATLQSAWTSLQDLRSVADTSQSLTSSWTHIRGDLGELIRHWERGKDIVARLDQSAQPNTDAEEPEEGQEGDLEPMPAFLRAWEEEQDPSSAATDSVRSTSVDTHDTFSSHAHDILYNDAMANEVLPPPGQDMVFESVPMPATSQRSKMTREERIKLMKEARENAAQAESQGKGVVEMGGDVVGELKSMIGIIRKRKGIPETEPSAVEQIQEEVTRDERHRLPKGFADDLKKAFVFPTPHIAEEDGQ